MKLNVVQVSFAYARTIACAEFNLKKVYGIVECLKSITY